MELTATHRNWQVRILTTTYRGLHRLLPHAQGFRHRKDQCGPGAGRDLAGGGAPLDGVPGGVYGGAVCERVRWAALARSCLILIGLGISIGCSVVFGISNSYAMFMSFMILNGLVQASGWPGVVGGVAHWLAPKERGTIMGLWS